MRLDRRQPRDRAVVRLPLPLVEHVTDFGHVPVSPIGQGRNSDPVFGIAVIESQADGAFRQAPRPVVLPFFPVAIDQNRAGVFPLQRKAASPALKNRPPVEEAERSGIGSQKDELSTAPDVNTDVDEPKKGDYILDSRTCAILIE